MSGYGAPVFLFDAQRRQSRRLPPRAAGLISLRLNCSDTDRSGLSAARAVLMTDTLHRVLAWKGYQVSTNTESRGSRSSGIDVVVQSQDRETGGDLGVICRLAVGPVQLHGPCRYELWHREQRAATLSDLVNQGVTVLDFRLAMLMAGHYQRRRRFWCGDAHGPGFLLDARITRGRMRRIMDDLAPLPAVPSYPETRRLLSSSAGEQVLGQVDTALGENLHTPRAVATLYPGFALR